MRAMQLHQTATITTEHPPLQLVDVPIPTPQANQVLLKVEACAVCHTELDEIEGRTAPPQLPIILGHQIVGTVEQIGANVSSLTKGKRVGVGWIFSACGHCHYCQQGQDNLCQQFKATGRDVNGGYAEYVAVDADFVVAIPDSYTPEQAAPLLCGGAIGYRSLRLANLENGQVLGLSGFGGSNHLVLQLAKYLYPQSAVYVFARSVNEQQFALQLGATWAGDYSQIPPTAMNAIIDTTPVWQPILSLLQHLAAGGRMVINAIRKENTDINIWLALDYARDLWHEKEIKSVANVASQDIAEFLPLAAQAGIKPEIQCYALEQANQALIELKTGQIRGTKVLKVNLS